MRTGTGHAVAGDELAAAHLRSGDVHVAVGGLGRVDAQEGRAVAEHLDDALGDRRLGVVVGVLGVARARRCAPRSRRGRAAGARAARGASSAPASSLRRSPRASSSRSSGAVVVEARAASGASARRGAGCAAGRSRRRPRRRRRRASAPRRPRRSSRVAGASPRMRSIRSALRSRRNPSRPSWSAIACRSASGLASSSERSSTAAMWCLLRCGWAVGVPPRWTAAGTRERLSLAARSGPRALTQRSARPRSAGEPVVAQFVGEREIPARRRRSPRSAARTVRKSAAAATSCTRKMCAPGVGAVRERGQRAGQPLARRAAGQRADEVLARDRHQQRPAELVQAIELREQADRLRGRLGEVGARVDDQLLARDARGAARRPCARAGRRSRRRRCRRRVGILQAFGAARRACA